MSNRSWKRVRLISRTDGSGAAVAVWWGDGVAGAALAFHGQKSGGREKFGLPVQAELMDNAFRQIIAGKNLVLCFQIGVRNFIQLEHLLRIGNARIFLVNFNQGLSLVDWFLLDRADQHGYKHHQKGGQNRPPALSNDSPPGHQIGRLFHRRWADCSLDGARFRACEPRLGENTSILFWSCLLGPLVTTCRSATPAAV